jgi:hypothetical protein
MKIEVLKTIFTNIFLILISLSIFSCAMFSPIIGKWQDTESSRQIEFTRDGKVIIKSSGHLTTGTYELIGDDVVKLKLEGLVGGFASLFGGDTWQYSISGNTMTVLAAGNTSTFNRINATASIKPTSSKIASATTALTPTTIATTLTPITTRQTPPTSTTIQRSTVTPTTKTISAANNSILSTKATPVISSVSKISAIQTQAITINGHGFGNMEPYNGNSPYIQIKDITYGWNAGHKTSTGQSSNLVTLNITKWVDNQIIISGFSGDYGKYILHVGDKILINVWNAPSGTGSASYSVVCGASVDAIPSIPVIDNVTNISTIQDQIITIFGNGFGNLDSYDGNSPYIEITNLTLGWHAGYNGSPGLTHNKITLNVTKWSDNQVIISGFTGIGYKLNVGDNIQIKIWNIPSGEGPAYYSLACMN